MHIRNTRNVVIRILICIFAFVASGNLIQQIYAQDTNRPNNGFMPALSPDGTLVAFVSDQDERRDLWIMNADGTNPLNVTTPIKTVYPYLPEWSPDSRHILFLSSDFSLKDSLPDLWLVLLDNRKLQLLTTALPVVNPKWSPDGKSIAFELYEDLDNSSIRLMDSDGKNMRELISGGRNTSPQWSHDGKSITYISSIGDETQLKLTEIDTGNTRILSTNIVTGYAWAPQSNLIIYAALKSGNYFYADIWLVQTDTAAEFKLTDNPIPMVSDIKWSPDQEKILFVSPSGDNTEIMMLVLKEKSIANITIGQEGHNFDPNWFPDSEHILFRSNHLGKPSIWVMASDGTDAVDLINRAN